MTILGAIISAVYVLFLLGFALSFIFFEKGKIDLIERIALSIALSISVVPLVVFYTNLIGIKITMLSVIWQIGEIIIVAILVLFIKYHIKRKRHE